MIEQQPELRAALARMLDVEGGSGPRAQDLADVLWMARVAGLEPSVSADRPSDRPTVEPIAEPRELPTERPTPSEGPPEPGPAAEPRVELHPRDLGTQAVDPARRGVAVQVARPAALPGALALARALRPLRRPLRQPERGVGRTVLDEEATAEAAAELGMLLPVWRPDRGPLFSLDLVVDAGATMAVWHGLAGELATLLERHGAFAEVRCWSLDTDRPAPRLGRFQRRRGRASAVALDWSRALRDHTGRRVLLVLTDGVGPAWHGEELPDFLARSAGERPAAVLQVLPRRLWHRTALRTAPVEARSSGQGQPIPVFRATGRHPVVPRGSEGGGAAVRWLPVLEIHADWLAPWAELVAGRSAGWTPMLATPVGGGRPRPTRSAATAELLTAVELVARFRAGSSAEAYRLACHLAAAPLSLPVMRLVQREVVPESGQTDLAELFLSGLLEHRAGAADPDEVVYDFRDGVREELLAELTRTESVQVLERVLAKVSGRVAATFGGTLDFRALAAMSGAEGVPLPARSLPFAEVAVAVLAGAGGRYAALVRELSAGVAASSGNRGEVVEVRPLMLRDLLTPPPPVVSPPDLPYFLGREVELRLMAGVLESDRTLSNDEPMLVVVAGEPGLGGRRLVQEYVQRHGAQHAFVHWIDVQAQRSYLGGLEQLWAALVPNGSPLSSIPELAEQLRRHRNWLVVFDGADWAELSEGRADPVAAAFLMAAGAEGCVIATVDEAGTSGGPGNRAVITLEPFGDEELFSALRTRLGPAYDPADQQQAERLRDLVARMPRVPLWLGSWDLDAELAAVLQPAETGEPVAADLSLAEGPSLVINGRYRLVRLIGRGSLGTVWQAADLVDDQPVAIKFFDPSVPPDGEFLFRSQVAVLRELSHRGITLTYDAGLADEGYYLVQEYVEGGDLRSALEQTRPWSLSNGLAIAGRVAVALEYLHSNGIVHRDLKPANILLRLNGEPVLCDFGIDLRPQWADSADDDITVFSLVGPLATPRYMSPEQARGEIAPGPSSDLYSLGCVLYEVFTGRPPFTGAGVELARQHLSAEPVSPRRFRPDLPAALEELILDLLRKDPLERPSSASEVHGRLLVISRPLHAQAEVDPLDLQSSAFEDHRLLRTISGPLHAQPEQAEPLRFSLLGEVRVWRADEPVELASAEQRAVLAVLLRAAGQAVSMQQLMEAVWRPAERPRRAEEIVLRQLRGLHDIFAFAPVPRLSVDPELTTTLLNCKVDTVDANVFERHIARAEAARAVADWPTAQEHALAAIKLWGGTPLAGLSGPFVERERARLSEAQLHAHELRLEANLYLGQTERLLAELNAFTAEHPLRERFQGLLMLALHRAGRRAEAALVYATFARFLDEELGVKPGLELSALHARMTADDPDLLPAVTRPSDQPADAVDEELSLRFSVLGPLRAWRRGEQLSLGSPQQQAVFAALLMNRGQAVTMQELVDAVWGDRPPEREVAAVRTYVSRLRVALDPNRESRPTVRILEAVGDGFRLRIGPEACDLDAFETGVANAATARAAGDLRGAERLLRAALDLWHGAALAGLEGPFAQTQRQRLAQRRLDAVEQLYEVSLDLGRHEHVVTELGVLADENPLREGLRELFMLALYRSGRRAEALAAYRQGRDVLRNTWGIEAGPALTGLYRLATVKVNASLTGSVAEVREAGAAVMDPPPKTTAEILPEFVEGRRLPPGNEDPGAGLAFGLAMDPVRLVVGHVDFDRFEFDPITGDLSVRQPAPERAFARFEDEPFFLAFGERGAGKTALVRMLVKQLTERYTADQIEIMVVDVSGSLLDVVPPEYLAAYADAPSKVPRLVANLSRTCHARRSSNAQGASRLEQQPELFLIVDGYTPITARLGPLIEHIPFARDIGLRVILTCDVDRRRDVLADPFLGLLREHCHQGVLLSGDPTVGPLLGSVTPRHRLPGRGAFVSPGVPEGTVVQIGWLPPS